MLLWISYYVKPCHKIWHLPVSIFPNGDERQGRTVLVNVICLESHLKLYHIFHYINDLYVSTVEVVSRERLVQLVTTLIAMLVIQLEKSPNASVLPFETLSPWILLHRMLTHEEKLQKQAEKDIQDAEGKKSGKLMSFHTFSHFIYITCVHQYLK